MELSGKIIHGTEMEVIDGSLFIENGEIQRVTETETESSDVIIPAFINAHTHIGDSIAKEAGRGLSLDEVVAPPDGLKHRILRNADKKSKIEGMIAALTYMHETGTTHIVDFREGGQQGVSNLREALNKSHVTATIMGRGDIDVLEQADGYGASGARDNSFQMARRKADELGKPFGIHSGERDPDDIDDALAYNPDFVVHMVHARERDIQRLGDRDIPVAVCPRSNLVTGVGLPPVEDLVESTTVALGTDNVMLNTASMWREMEFTSKLFDLSDAEVLRMATVNGGSLIGRDDIGVIEEGAKAKITVLRGDRSLSNVRDIVAGVVRRCGAYDIKKVIA